MKAAFGLRGVAGAAAFFAAAGLAAGLAAGFAAGAALAAGGCGCCFLGGCRFGCCCLGWRCYWGFFGCCHLRASLTNTWEIAQLIARLILVGIYTVCKRFSRFHEEKVAKSPLCRPGAAWKGVEGCFCLKTAWLLAMRGGENAGLRKMLPGII
jgi:hypothetical protein